MKKKTLSIIIAIVTCLSAFAVTACSKEETFEEKVAKGNADLVIATVTVRNEKTDRVMFEEKLFFETDNRLPVPERTSGATFLNYENKDGMEFFDVNGRQIETIKIKNDLTLYARYEYKSCTITFNLNGGEFVGSGSDIHLYYMDDTPVLPVAEKEGFIFMGWRDEAGKMVSDDQGNPINIEFNSENYNINAAAICRLTAVFDDYQPTVTFDFNDGSIQNQTITVRYNSFIETPDDTHDTGSRMIVGWSTYMNESPRNAQMNYNERITSDITLYAVWDSYYEVELVYIDNADRSEIGNETLKVFNTRNTDFPTVAEANKKFDFGATSLSWYKDSSFMGGTQISNPKTDYSVTTFYGRVFR